MSFGSARLLAVRRLKVIAVRFQRETSLAMAA